MSSIVDPQKTEGGPTVHEPTDVSGGGAEIFACPNGPLLVRGAFEIRDPENGNVVTPGRTVALCRCGVSAIKPFCDGSHKLIKFTTAPPETMANEEPTG